MKLFFLLGNQLFSEKYLEKFRKDHIFFMAEDYQLCTYEKHHKQKILLFLSAMRSHADKLKKNKFKIEYSSIEDKSFKSDYIEKLKKIIKTQKISEVSSFEIEDKFFEKKISHFFKKEKIKWNDIQTPMFLNSRENFKKYLWCRRRDLNPQPPDYKSGALPVELRRQFHERFIHSFTKI